MDELYGASGFDMNRIAMLEREFGITPKPPQELISRGRNAPRARTSVDPERGSFMEFVDRVANASPRDWASNIVRYGGGYLSGIPSAVPGVGTLLGGAIGGGSESLAELIAGEEQNPTAIGVASGVGMIPFGGIVGTGARAGARGAPLLARAAAIGQQTGANALKGAALGSGQEMAYRFGEAGQLPGRDYGLRELVIPAAVGAGGLALAGEVSSRALGRMGVEPPAGGSGRGNIPTPDGPVLEGGSPAARRANYRYEYQGGPRPSLDELYGHLTPEPLDFSRMRVDTPTGPGASSTRPPATLGADPRRLNAPLREGQPIDLSAPEPFLVDTPADFPSLQGPARPQGFDPRRAGAPMRAEGGPIDLTGPEPFLPGPMGDMPPLEGPHRPQGFDPRRANWTTPTRRPEDLFFTGRGTDAPRMPSSSAVRTAQEALGAGGRPDDDLLRFFGMERPAAPVASEPAPGAGGREMAPALPQEPPAPTVGRMTAADLLERLRGGDTSVRTPGLTGEQLPRDWTHELKLMLDELAEFPFQRQEVNTNIDDALHGGPGTRDSAQGAGWYANNPDHPNLIQTVAGAPVFHDIMQGKSGTRSAAARGLQRILEGGRPTSLTDRAVDVAQQRLLGGLGRSLPTEIPDVNITRPRSRFDLGDIVPERFKTAAASEPAIAPASTEVPAGTATGAPDDVHPLIKEFYDELVPRWEADVLNQQQRGDPFIIDPRESLEEFSRRILESEPRDLWSRERRIRKAIDAERAGRGEGGFIDPELLMPLGGTLAGGVAGAALNPDDPWGGTAAGAGLGFAAGMTGRAMARGGFRPGVVEPPPSRALQRIMAADALGAEDLRPRSYRPDGRGTFTGEDIPRGSRFNRADYPNLASEAEVRADLERLTAPGAPRPTDMSELPALPRTGTDAGFMDPQLAMSLGGAAAGALAGSALEPEHPFIGAGAGAGLGFLATNPRAQRAVGPYLYDAMLSALATPKNVLGVTGSIAGAAFEHPDRAGRILSEFFSPETARSVIERSKAAVNPRRWSEPEPHTNRWAMEDTNWRGPFTRVMGAIDQSTNEALQRAGFAEDQARTLTGTSDPVSKTGQNVLGVARNMPMILPFARTGTNLVEQGLLRTPGVNLLPDVRAMEQPGMASAGRRALTGLAAIAAGAGYGYASSEGGPLEDLSGSTLEKVMMPGMGLASVPGTAASAAMRGFMDKGTPLEGMNAANKAFWDQVPLPEAVPPQEVLSRFAPAIGAYLSPVEPKKFETRHGIFDPTIARLPFLNEMILDRKGSRLNRLPNRRQVRPYQPER